MARFFECERLIFQQQCFSRCRTLSLHRTPWPHARHINASRHCTSVSCSTHDDLREAAAQYSQAVRSYQSAAVDESSGMRNGSDSNVKCWLVGAGPGSLDHLTLKAATLIQQAEVILWDDLGTKAAMEAFASETAERVYVGKRGLQKSIKQSEIDVLLVQYCQQGKRVVRLKGGCPSVFSRMSSEVAALSDAGIAYRVLPGVSSATAAPLLAGIPLTDKLLSKTFAVTSGHDPASVDWQALEGCDTIVFLMAGYSLPALVEGLQNISDDDLPVAVIRDASCPQQRVWRATVSTVVEYTKGEQLSPCIIVVGEIVGAMIQ